MAKLPNSNGKARLITPPQITLTARQQTRAAEQNQNERAGRVPLILCDVRDSHLIAAGTIYLL